MRDQLQAQGRPRGRWGRRSAALAVPVFPAAAPAFAGHGAAGRDPAVGPPPAQGAPRQEERLARVPQGSVVCVHRVKGDEAFRGRMMAMGIIPGASISVLQAGKGRPLLIALGGSRLMLDGKSSELITIRPSGNGDR